MSGTGKNPISTAGVNIENFMSSGQNLFLSKPCGHLGTPINDFFLKSLGLRFDFSIELPLEN